MSWVLNPETQTPVFRRQQIPSAHGRQGILSQYSLLPTEARGPEWFPLGSVILRLWGALKNPNAQITSRTILFRTTGSKTPAAAFFKAPKRRQYVELPRWLSGKESACQSRRCRFDPWVTSVHLYMTTGKNHIFDYMNFVDKLMPLLFNTLSRFVIAFLSRSKRLLISWLQSLYKVILEPSKIKSVTVSIVSPSIHHEVMGLDAMIFIF